MKQLLVAILSIGLMGMGSSRTSRDVGTWVNDTGALRMKALQEAEKAPYRQDQHLALKAYFGQLAEMAYALKEDANLASRFNWALRNSDMQGTCSKVFVTKAQWKTIVERCTRNRFFLCAEEVRAYPDVVAAIGASLDATQKARFDSSPACRL